MRRIAYRELIRWMAADFGFRGTRRLYASYPVPARVRLGNMVDPKYTLGASILNPIWADIEDARGGLPARQLDAGAPWGAPACPTTGRLSTARILDISPDRISESKHPACISDPPCFQDEHGRTG